MPIRDYLTGSGGGAPGGSDPTYEVDGGPGIMFPEPVPGEGGTPSIGGFSNDASLSGATRTKIGFLGIVTKAGVLDGIEFYCGSGGAGSNIKISFQGISAGILDNVIDEYRTIAAYTTGWNASGIMSSDGTDNGTKRTVAVGDLIGVSFEYIGGTTGSMWVYAFSLNATATLYVNSPIVMTAQATQASAHASQGSAAGYGILLKYNDGTYTKLGDGSYPLSSSQTMTFASNSTPDERGNVITLGGSKISNGAWFRGQLSGALNVVLYDSTGTVVATSTNPLLKYWSHASSLYRVYWDGGEVELPAGLYRVVLKPTTTTSVGLTHATMSTAGHLDCWPGGRGCYYTSRVDAGSWTDATAQRAWCGLLINGSLAA